jgi:multidrug efflux system membrane fusion protein
MLTRSESAELSQPQVTRRSTVAMLGRASVQAFVMVAVLAAGIAGMQSLIRTKPVLPARPPLPTVYSVETVIAKAGDFRPVYTAYGEVVAGRTVELRSLVAGEVLAVSPLLKAGAAVPKGEALVTIDRFNYEGALDEARANLAEAQAKLSESRTRIALEETRLSRAREQLELSARDLERIRSLRETGAATEKQLEDREMASSQRAAAVDETQLAIAAEKARLDQQEAVTQRLEWKVRQAERNLADTVLIAPFDGVVRTAQAEAGKMVSTNDVVVSLYEQGNLEVRFTLTDERIARLLSDDAGVIGRQVEVVWNVGGARQAVPARIDRYGSDIAASRGGVEVFAVVEKSGTMAALRPGAFVEVRVPDRLFPGHHRLPESAVFHGDTVYAVKDGSLTARKVSVSAWDGDHALVSGGIADGDEVLVTRIAEVGEGLRVEPVAGSALEEGK